MSEPAQVAVVIWGALIAVVLCCWIIVKTLEK